MRNTKILIAGFLIIIIGLLVNLYCYRPNNTCKPITEEQKQILSIVDSIFKHDTSRHTMQNNSVNSLINALSKPIDVIRANQMKLAARSKVKYASDLIFIEPQISVVDFLDFINKLTNGENLNKGILVYPALEDNNLISIICLTSSETNSGDKAYYKFSNIDYRKQNKMLLKDTITRAEALIHIKNYFVKVQIDGKLQKNSEYYKTSHYYKWEDIWQYLYDNDYFSASTFDQSNYYFELNHGYITNDMAQEFFFKLGGNCVVDKPEDLIGYSGFIELHDKIGSVTRGNPSMELPSRRFGIEEIAKPCPPRCDDFGGITREEFYP